MERAKNPIFLQQGGRFNKSHAENEDIEGYSKGDMAKDGTEVDL